MKVTNKHHIYFDMIQLSDLTFHQFIGRVSLDKEIKAKLEKVKLEEQILMSDLFQIEN